MSQVAVVRCEDYDRGRVREAMARLFELLGGAARFVSPGERILLKPNLLKPAPPGAAVTTHPEVVRAVIECLRRGSPPPGPRLSLGDSPAWSTLERVAEETGVSAICREAEVPLVPFRRPQKVENREGAVFSHLVLDRGALEADGIVNLPKMKMHCQLYVSAGVKNLFGCVAGKRKAWWHFKAGNYGEYFPLMLMETARLLRPRISILDAVWAMEGQGPANGRPRRLGLLLASADPVALDRVACEVGGVEAGRLRTLEAARITGWGQPDLERIEILGLSPEEARAIPPLAEPRMMPIGFSLPRVVKSTLKQQWLIRVEGRRKRAP